MSVQNCFLKTSRKSHSQDFYFPQISFFLVILAHHTCSLENTFAAKLLMHMFFAGFVLHVSIALIY